MFIDFHSHSDRRLRSLTSRAPADQKKRMVFQVCFWERRKLQLVATFAFKPYFMRYCKGLDPDRFSAVLPNFRTEG